MRKFRKLTVAVTVLILALSLFACGNSPSGASTTQSSRTEGELVADSGSAQPLAADPEAYLFVHFVGDGPYHGEQLYFTVSKDAKNWKVLNDGKPTLWSGLGEEGVRDPHIIRSQDGSKFYIIATDLSIYHRGIELGDAWGTCQRDGSDSLIVWESTDLVNWSEPRKVKVGRPNCGCVWAPESIYDKEKNAYMVFWASPTPSVGDDWHHRIYRAYTTDFVNFTEPEVYMERDGGVIDTTIIEYDNMYYRFTKDETGGRKYIFMEACDSLSGDFEEVATYTLNGNSYKSVTNVEGATIFKVNGQKKWYLYFDDFGGKGYYPFATEDLSVGEFTEQSPGNFSGLRSGAHMRHGSVLPITLAEYNALVAKYDGTEEETGEVVFSLDFDNQNLETTLGSAEAVGALSYVDGVNGGKAVQFSNNKYIKIKTGKDGTNPLAGLHTATVSFAVKSSSSGTSWAFFAAPDDTPPVWSGNTHIEKYLGIYDTADKLYVQRHYLTGGNRPEGFAENITKQTWTHITVVYERSTTILYINGVKKGEIENGDSIHRLLRDNPVIYLGRANWGGGEYSNSSLDAVKIHNYALGDSAVQALYKADMGIA